VVAIMTAEPSVLPGKFSYAETALGALLVGLAMCVTRIFVGVVKKDTDLDAHLPLRKAGGIILNSLLVMASPCATALLIIVAALMTARWPVLLDVVLYLGMATVFATGFLSSYVLDGSRSDPLSRGAACGCC
jgi:hypothetical protein